MKEIEAAKPDGQPLPRAASDTVPYPPMPAPAWGSPLATLWITWAQAWQTWHQYELITEAWASKVVTAAAAYNKAAYPDGQTT